MLKVQKKFYDWTKTAQADKVCAVFVVLFPFALFFLNILCGTHYLTYSDMFIYKQGGVQLWLYIYSNFCLSITCIFLFFKKYLFGIAPLLISSFPCSPTISLLNYIILGMLFNLDNFKYGNVGDLVLASIHITALLLALRILFLKIKRIKKLSGYIVYYCTWACGLGMITALVLLSFLDAVDALYFIPMALEYPFFVVLAYCLWNTN